MRIVGIVVFPKVEELDFVGPLEVFGLAARQLEDRASLNALAVVTASPTGETVVCAHGLTVIPNLGFDNVPHLDVLVVPGGKGAREQMRSAKMLDFVLSQSRKCELVTSVCTGALILAAAGLLSGKRATTHWAAVDELRQMGEIIVERRRFIHDGKVITSAGISAGVDMALYATQFLFGEEIRNAVAKRLEHYTISENQAW